MLVRMKDIFGEKQGHSISGGHWARSWKTCWA